MKNGIAVSLITPFDNYELEEIKKYCKSDIKEIKNDGILNLSKEGDAEK